METVAPADSSIIDSCTSTKLVLPSVLTVYVLLFDALVAPVMVIISNFLKTAKLTVAVFEDVILLSEALKPITEPVLTDSSDLVCDNKVMLVCAMAVIYGVFLS
jgi:hypothetical protein